MSDYMFQYIDEYGFAAMRDEWNVLLENSLSNNIFLTWEWLYTWWRHYKKPDRDLKVICARNRAGDLKGVFPMFLEHGESSRGALQFLGTGETCSDHLDFILENGKEEVLLRSVTEFILDEWKYCNMSLRDFPKGSRNLLCLRQVFQEYRIPHIICQGEICPIKLLPGTKEELYAELPTKFRYNLKRSIKKFYEKFGTNPRAIENPLDLPSAFESLFALHRSRWSKKGERSDFLSEEMQEFHVDVGKLFFERGWLRLFILDGDVRVAGSLYCFKYNQRMSYYQTGFDPTYEKWSVGSILILKAMEDAISNGIKLFDFLRGPEEYKWRWTNKYRETVRVVAYTPTLSGVLKCRCQGYRHSLSSRYRSMARPSEIEGKELSDF